MKMFLFGCDANTLFIIALITALLTLGFIFKVITSESFKYRFISSYKFITVSLILVTMLSYWGSEYLNSPIDSTDAVILEKIYDESYFIPNGEDFRKQVNSLAKEKGVVTIPELSYLDEQINKEYINKSDWNSLAKTFNKLK